MTMRQNAHKWNTSEDDIRRIARELASYENVDGKGIYLFSVDEPTSSSSSPPSSVSTSPASGSTDAMYIDDALQMIESMEEEEKKGQDMKGRKSSTRKTKSSERRGKPSHSYIALISMAILSSEEKRMLLGDIYRYIATHFPYYKKEDRAWRNSVRHNLSLNECFIKYGKSDIKGNYWAIHPACVGDFSKGDFRRRQARQRARSSNLKESSDLFYNFQESRTSHYIPMSIAASNDRLQEYCRSIESFQTKTNKQWTLTEETVTHPGYMEAALEQQFIYNPFGLQPYNSKWYDNKPNTNSHS